MTNDQRPVFVYGTLRTGQTNHRVIRPFTQDVHRAELPDHRLYASGLPYVGPGETGEVVIGDLVTLNPEQYEPAMSALDALEGIGYGLYRREALPVRFQTGAAWRTGLAWVYLGGTGFCFDPDLRVPHGDWELHLTADQRDQRTYSAS